MQLILSLIGIFLMARYEKWKGERVYKKMCEEKGRDYLVCDRNNKQY